MTILETQVTELLTSELGRAPTAAELANGLISPWTLAQIHNTLTPGTSTFAISATENIQDALDKLSANGGGTLYLQAGTYLPTTDLMLSSNTQILGVGSGATIVDFGAGAYQLKIQGTDTYTTGTISINTSDTSVIGVGTTWDSSMIGRSVFLDFQWYEISAVPDATTLTLSSAYLGDNLSGSSYTIANPIQSVKMEGFTLQNTSTDVIDVENAENITFSDITVMNGATGMVVNNTAVITLGIVNAFSCETGFTITNTYGITFDNCFATQTSVGDGYHLDTVSVATIFNSSADTCAGNGVSLVNVSNFGFDDSSLINSTGNGIALSGGTSIGLLDTQISNNGGDGINISGNSDASIISTNTIKSNGGYGINIVDSNCNDNLISSNSFSGNSSGAVSDSGTGTLIRSNVGESDN